jgi:hypothetical protein
VTKRNLWTKEEEKTLIDLMKNYSNDFDLMYEKLGRTRTKKQIRQKARKII